MKKNVDVTKQNDRTFAVAVWSKEQCYFILLFTSKNIFVQHLCSNTTHFHILAFKLFVAVKTQKVNAQDVE